VTVRVGRPNLRKKPVVFHRQGGVGGVTCSADTPRAWSRDPMVTLKMRSIEVNVASSPCRSVMTTVGDFEEWLSGGIFERFDDEVQRAVGPPRCSGSWRPIVVEVACEAEHRLPI
jgi:hypothetical protein